MLDKHERLDKHIAFITWSCQPCELLFSLIVAKLSLLPDQGQKLVYMIEYMYAVQL